MGTDRRRTGVTKCGPARTDGGWDFIAEPLSRGEELALSCPSRNTIGGATSADVWVVSGVAMPVIVGGGLHDVPEAASRQRERRARQRHDSKRLARIDAAGQPTSRAADDASLHSSRSPTHEAGVALWRDPAQFNELAPRHYGPRFREFGVDLVRRRR